jgi:SPP1 gp7 family putative phage head morphogenesis protein
VDKPTVNAQLADSGILQGISGARVAKKLSHDVLAMLAQLRDQLTGKLSSTEVMTEWQRQRATQLLHFAKDAIAGTYEKISDKTAAQLEGLGAVEVHKLTKTVNDAVGVELSARMAPQQLEAIANTKRSLVQGAVQSSWWRNQSESLQHGFSTEVQKGLLRGAPIQDISRATKDLIQVKAVQAEALVRTATASVQSESARKYFDSNKDIISGVTWLATLCRRTCLTCAALDGRAWAWPSLEPIGGNKVKFPGLPPEHFSCRCTLVPVLRSWEELSGLKLKQADDQTVEVLFKQKLKARGFSDEKAAQIHRNQRASMDGAVPKTQNFESWLKGKPVEFQQAVLGPARHQLWHDGKASIDQMVDGDGSPLSVAELHQAVKDNVAVPQKAAVEGQAGLSLGERNILSAMRSSAVQESAYKSAWLSGKGIVVDQATTHTLKAEEFVQLKKAKGLVHLSNALAAAEFWDDSELRLWASLSGFDGAKLVMPNGKVAIVKLKSGQKWTPDDLRTYLRAMRTAKLNPGKYLSTESQIAFAFRATGKVTFATTVAGEV